MKTNRSYIVAASIQRGGVFHSKLFVAALIIAMLLASLPAATAFAAPAGDQGTTEITDPELEWKNKLDNLRWAGFYYDSVRFYPADFERSSDLSRVHELLEKYGVALRAANTVVQNHAGFDIEGNLKHEVQAAKSIRDLAMYLHIMRGLREKIDAVPRQY